MDFIYKLIPVSQQALHQPGKEVIEILEAHAAYADQLMSSKIAKFIGRTEAKEFGIIVFSAEGEPEAFEIMSKDPAIKNHLMKGELYPFSIVFPQ